MKKIEAIVRKEKFADVCAALEKSGVGGIIVSEALGFGHHRNGLRPKTKIEIYCDEFQVETLVNLIRKQAMTGTSGDGKIAVIELENLYRIRTGEEGASAI